LVISKLDEAGRSPKILLNVPAGLNFNFIFRNLLAQETELLNKRRFKALSLYVVKRDHVSQSGSTFCCFLLRQIEKLSDGACYFDEIPKDCIYELTRGLDYLRKTGKQMLLGVSDLHLGELSYRGEVLSVLDVYNRLSESPITVLASTLKGSIKSSLTYDHFLNVEPRKSSFSLEHYIDSLHLIRRSYGEFPVKILASIVRIRRPRTLFEICDLLEADWEGEVFEPKVEKALWRLAPFLHESRDSATHEKKWAPIFNNRRVQWNQLVGEKTNV
jgi:hypothetical protein